MSNPIERLAAALSDRYRIESELGSGGMATVYLAEDLKHHRKVAVKVLRPDLAATLGPDRFLREIRIAAQLQHPHILTLIDSGEADGFLYYVMPYVKGESLRDKLLREGELPVGDAVRVLRDVVDALAHAHAEGVVHRDIKPDNVLLSGRHALVTDFGVAKAVSEATGRDKLTTAGVALGTPSYMAPEQAAADPHVDHRVDIYAVGAVAYELLTGRPPFTGTTPQQVLSAQVTEAPEPVTKHRATVPPALGQMVMKCLEKKPADRWQTAEELLPHLEAMVTPSEGVAPTAARTVADRAMRRPVRVAVAGGLLAILLAVGGWWVTKGLVGGRGRGRAAETDIPSIAVLPFVDLSPGGDYEYFGDGMAEGLITSLGKVEGLRVTARTSAFALGGAIADVQSIGEQLNVDAVLEGSVQRSGSRVRVNARLGDASDGLNLWSETYEREWTDLFELQDDLVHAIVGALLVELVDDANVRLVQQPTEDVEAYNSYLLGRFHWNRRTSSDFEIAATHFRDAIARDSNFALAYAGLAGVHVLPASPIPFPESYSIAKGLAERALDLDSTLAEAHTVLAWIAFENEWDWDGAESGFQRAIALDPEYSTAHMWYSEVLAMTARLDSAITEAERAQLLEPVSPIVTWVVGRLLVFAGRDTEAEAEFLKVLAMDPAFSRSRSSLENLYFRQGREEQAFEMVRQAEALRGAPPDSLAAIELAYADSGMGGVYRRRLNDPALPGFRRLQLHAIVGETGTVLDLLQTRLERGGGLPFGVLASAPLWAPEFATVRRNPRFRVILEEMGLAEIWRGRLGTR